MSATKALSTRVLACLSALRKAASVFVAALAVSGCVGSSHPLQTFDFTGAKSLQSEEVTKDTVATRFGEPGGVWTHESSGREIWNYHWGRIESAAGDREDSSITFLFDDTGRLLGTYRFHSYAVGDVPEQWKSFSSPVPLPFGQMDWDGLTEFFAETDKDRSQEP